NANTPTVSSRRSSATVTMVDYSIPHVKTRPAIGSGGHLSQKDIQNSSPDAKTSDQPCEPEISVATPNLTRINIAEIQTRSGYDRPSIPGSATQQRSQSVAYNNNSLLHVSKPLLSKDSSPQNKCRSDSASSVDISPIPSGPLSANTETRVTLDVRTTSETESNSREAAKSAPLPFRNANFSPQSKEVCISQLSSPDPTDTPDVEPAPASGMYWSVAPVSGTIHSGIRAHTLTLVGSNIYMFGGCNSKSCFNELYVIDADSFHMSCPHVCGDIPIPLRAMTCTAVGKKLVVFGGGDGPAYYNDVYVLDTVNFRWSKPTISGERLPSKRRAHTACFWQNGIYIFGGGDGTRALNDVWRLDVSDVTKMSWKLISAPSQGTEEKIKPKPRGYHTANMIGSKLIIYGGSDGGECFQDVWVFDAETLKFSPVHIPVSFPRLSHSATIVGSYLFVIGGHDGIQYSNEVLLL
ncbi:hypothetical protein K3495_g11143, partial [Podosphaera aphanis]